MSFGFWDNAALTQAHGGITEKLHRTDLSDGSQDFVIYLGSTDDTLVLYAASDPGNDDIVISIVDILPEWEATTAYSVGDRVQPVGGNGYVYECTVAGTSDSSEPTWPVPPSGYGTTVTDDGVTWALQKPQNETTEIKIATSSAGLDSAVAGASLNLGPSIDGGVDNKVEIHGRVTNTVTLRSTTVGNAEIALQINDADEYEA